MGYSLSPYKIMWVTVMFDLPVGTKAERKTASKFRLTLLDLGYEMAQLSVYMRFCSSPEKADAEERKVEKKIPEKGVVYILRITDKQFGAIKRYRQKRKIKIQSHPDQLNIF